MPFDLIDIKRQPVEEVLQGLRGSRGDSIEAGQKLIRMAAEAGLGLRDYLTLAVDTRQGEHAESLSVFNGYEATLVHLDLPFRNDFENGVLLQAASETFQKFPGTRALFPEVIDDMLRWKHTQDQLETTEGMVAQRRTISGNEMISTIVDDDSAQLDTFVIPELARVPVRTIRTSETSVKMFKHGSAYRTSYEFNRRASLDILTPFANRVARELEISKVAAATDVLINGDGVNGAAPVEDITTFGGTAGTLDYKSLAKWIMNAAKEGKPIDKIVGNYDMFVELLFLFTPTLASEISEASSGPRVLGTPSINVTLPILNGSVDFSLSSSMAADKLIGYTLGETLEELIEAGSSISENERSILNQAITFVRTEAYHDSSTRQLNCLIYRTPSIINPQQDRSSRLHTGYSDIHFAGHDAGYT